MGWAYRYVGSHETLTMITQYGSRLLSSNNTRYIRIHRKTSYIIQHYIEETTPTIIVYYRDNSNEIILRRQT